MSIGTDSEQDVRETAGTGLGKEDGWTRAAIVNKRGLHARAAAKFVKTAEAFDAAIEVEKSGQIVSGHSIMGLMMLAAAPGCHIRLRAEGPDAASALRALIELISQGFHEHD